MTDTRKTNRIRYDEGCLAAHALNVIGDRWALLVVRELVFAPKRFQMIRTGLPGVTASVLTARLTQLEETGVINHDQRLGIYSLTETGHGLLPVLEALCRWALIVPGHDPSRFISPSALMISMVVNLVPERAGGSEMQAGFSFGGEAFEIRLIEGHLHTTAVALAQAPFVLSGSGNTLAMAVYGARPISTLIAQDIVSVTGDVAAAETFLSMFSLAPQS